MKKNFLKIIIILSMLLLTSIPLSANAESYGDLTYTISNNEITITGCNTSVTDVVIPTEIDNLPVTSIGKFAFSGHRKLANVVIGEGVTSIEEYAFGNCKGLVNIQLPNSLKTIGRQAFYDCSRLTSISLPKNLNTINIMAFDNCSNLSNISIPDSVSTLESCAFRDCVALNSISIGNGVTSIKEETFRGCTNLTNIRIPNSVTSIGERAFYRCLSLNQIRIPNSVTTIGEYAFDESGLTEIIVPKSVTEINGLSLLCDNLKIIKYQDTEQKWNKILTNDSYISNITIIFNYASTETSLENNQFTVTPINIPNGSTIIFVCYNDKQMVYVEPFTYAGEETKTFIPDKEYDKVKVLVWENFGTCVPLCEAEDVPLN